ncbi:peptide deformylase [Candidatus Gottesmanbacteria bacterium RBG_16_52_11]|uniref:Peptide deformylase n=1 Tax=Candidatus Gottesmanbacteria bacterium RBG_16_52_11 TaxID=1798374 RepID=A0A1F5YNF6_9BACT|nr:MAG: peptide deformylase [Candidatus Gottesmanbacteria bacterium RBG_16_52_11]
MKPIVFAPDTILTTPAKDVTVFDRKLEQLVRSLHDTLKKTDNPKGVGLAATQIGESYRVFVTRPTEHARIRTYINPEILALEDADTGPRDRRLEGCLSIPNVWGKVRRAGKVTLRFTDETGNVKTEDFSGFPATIIQHETDHVNGILFTQRVLEQKGRLYRLSYDETGKETLEEILI